MELDLVVIREGAKGKVQMRVLGRVELRGILVETGPTKAESLEVADTSEDSGRVATNKVSAAVGYAAIGARFGGPWCAGARVGAEFGCCSALGVVGKRRCLL